MKSLIKLALQSRGGYPLSHNEINFPLVTESRYLKFDNNNQDKTLTAIPDLKPRKVTYKDLPADQSNIDAAKLNTT